MWLTLAAGSGLVSYLSAVLPWARWFFGRFRATDIEFYVRRGDRLSEAVSTVDSDGIRKVNLVHSLIAGLLWPLSLLVMSVRRVMKSAARFVMGSSRMAPSEAAEQLKQQIDAARDHTRRLELMNGIVPGGGE